MMFLVLYLGNVNLHTAKLSNNDKDKLERYLKDEVRNSLYLIFSLALQICEITMWFGRYINDHGNKDENLKKCVKIVGIIEQDEGICHVGSKVCLSSKFVQQKGWLGKKVNIVKYSENPNEDSKNMYPYFAYNIQLVENSGNNSK